MSTPKKAAKVAPPTDMEEHNTSLNNGAEEAPQEEVHMALTTKEVAAELDTDPRTLRKFLRSDLSGVEAVGQGKRYAITPKSIPSLTKKFEKWAKREQDAKAAREAARQEAEVEETEADDEELETEQDSLAEMTVKELQAIAKELEITGYSSMKKADLVEAIAAAS